MYGLDINHINLVIGISTKKKNIVHTETSKAIFFKEDGFIEKSYYIKVKANFTYFHVMW